MTEKGQAAPLPYNSLEISTDTASSGRHIYITDATGRKIAAIWGKADEKAFTADLLLRAVNSYEAMRKALEHAEARFECLVDYFRGAGAEADQAMCGVDAERMRKALADGESP
jgi:hypothetical protein